LFTESFRRGDKSPEVVQAILLLTYWKELDDTRAWLSVGYAIRLSMELGWHKLTWNEGDEDNLSQSEVERRRNIRNLERTWLVLFVYDRRYDDSVAAHKPSCRLIDPFYLVSAYKPESRA
jgi:hypothetical protein